jgi:hypothetical protein
MTNSLIAYCGLYCGACSFKTAFETNDKEHINNMPAYYDKYKNNTLKDCPGCRLENKCGECEIRDCAVKKRVDWCSQCNEYPCILINDFCNDGRPHHGEIMKNLESLKIIGEEEWINEMSKIWKCTKCGKKKSWYNKKCDCT